MVIYYYVFSLSVILAMFEEASILAKMKPTQNCPDIRLHSLVLTSVSSTVEMINDVVDTTNAAREEEEEAEEEEEESEEESQEDGLGVNEIVAILIAVVSALMLRF